MLCVIIQEKHRMVKILLYLMHSFFGNLQLYFYLLSLSFQGEIGDSSSSFFLQVYSGRRPNDKDDYNQQNEDTDQTVINLFTTMILKRQKQKN
jgi:hypothetical protein